MNVTSKETNQSVEGGIDSEAVCKSLDTKVINAIAGQNQLAQCGVDTQRLANILAPFRFWECANPN